MSGILNIAVSGLNAAAARVANATRNIVNASSTNFIPRDIISLSNSAGGIGIGVTTISQPRPTPPVTAPAPTNTLTAATIPVPTTQVNLAANLPAQAAAGFTSSHVPVQIYDSL